jgi:hypothetical protein
MTRKTEQDTRTRVRKERAHLILFDSPRKGTGMETCREGPPFLPAQADPERRRRDGEFGMEN